MEDSSFWYTTNLNALYNFETYTQEMHNKVLSLHYFNLSIWLIQYNKMKILWVPSPQLFPCYRFKGGAVCFLQVTSVFELKIIEHFYM